MSDDRQRIRVQRSADVANRFSRLTDQVADLTALFDHFPSVQPVLEGVLVPWRRT
jgi:hypothetical protein